MILSTLSVDSKLVNVRLSSICPERGMKFDKFVKMNTTELIKKSTRTFTDRNGNNNNKKNDIIDIIVVLILD